MAVRKLATLGSSEELLQELLTKEVSQYYKLDNLSQKIIRETTPTTLVQAARAERDIYSPYDKLSQYCPTISGDTLSKIIVALSQAGFIFPESYANACIRKFLTEEIMKQEYGTTQEYENRNHYSEERTSAFDRIIKDTVTDEESAILARYIFGPVNQKNSERDEWLREMALAKIKGNRLKVNCMRTSKEAQAFLDPKQRELTNIYEELVYCNAHAALKRVYNNPEGPWIIGPYNKIQ